MNANELAEILVSDSKHTSGRFTYSSRYIADIATMLHQQQAEIEALKAHPVKELTDEEIHQAIRRGFSREGFLSDGIFLEIKELLRNKQGVNSEQVPDFFFMENDLMGKR